ncbi:MAG TPA: helix-turn-helix domain-containing protein [Pseudonocardiaceae bacterium]
MTSREEPGRRPRPGPELIGTRLRHLLDLMEAGIAQVYADLGLPGFRPRFTPVVRVVAAAGPSSIRDIAEAIGVTHSAASQTVAQMAREGLVTLSRGDDARRRIVTLTGRARDVLPVLDAEWEATSAAARELEAELSYPISALVDEAITAIHRRPMRDRVTAAATHPAPRARERGTTADGRDDVRAARRGSPAERGDPGAEGGGVGVAQ